MVCYGIFWSGQLKVDCHILDKFLPVLRLFYRAHSKSLPDIIYENIGQNRVSTFLIRDQNHLLEPMYESRYMKDSLSYTVASLWNFIIYHDKEACVTLKCNQLRKHVSAEDYFIDFKFECSSASACYKMETTEFYILLIIVSL